MMTGRKVSTGMGVLALYSFV